MDSGDRTLKMLAEVLRLYKPPHSIPIQQAGSDSESAGRKTSPRAAVLVCLFQGENSDLRVILTKRSSTISSGPAEVPLPGGKREEGDADDIATATREAKEEIGLDRPLVNVATVLEPIVTKHGMIVVTVIGILEDKKAFVPSPNASEVELDENRREQEREWMGDKYTMKQRMRGMRSGF